ncbi:sigma-70 family RNA polymerase sigma factor [Streptomyces erythrochromogenes]|uniref:hypothetical protein n=1 Tax=Streptomyces erythrochromogenes TaxID=285574 RepID=UPI0036A582B5
MPLPLPATLALAYRRALTYREVARALRTPLPTIETRMRGGPARLRDRMRG